MKLTRVEGVIRRRLLVNFRIDPDVAQAQLPASFKPKLHDGYAVGGVCLIRLEEIRPKGMPRFLGLTSENAAHRFAVTWTDAEGEHEGVYIPRRDSQSLMNRLAGGRLFSGEHHAAGFTVRDDEQTIDIRMQSADGAVSLHVAAATVPELPRGSIFQPSTAPPRSSSPAPSATRRDPRTSSKRPASIRITGPCSPCASTPWSRATSPTARASPRAA